MFLFSPQPGAEMCEVRGRPAGGGDTSGRRLLQVRSRQPPFPGLLFPCKGTVTLYVLVTLARTTSSGENPW